MASLTDILGGIVNRFIPTLPRGEATKQDYLRLGRYNELCVLPLFNKHHALADEGSYFGTTVTPGTGIATIAAPTTLVDTAPFIVVKNIAPAGGKSVYLDLLKLINTAPGTAGAQTRWAVKIDANRSDPTGFGTGFGPATPQNCNAASDRQSVARVYAGALVSPAASAAVRLIDSGMFRTVIPVIGDQYTLTFGGLDPSLSGLIGTGTTQADRIDHCAPIVVDPGFSAYIHIWLPSQSAASSWEVVLKHFER